MRLLLRLKHWQLFLLTWGLPMLLNFLTFSNPVLVFKLFPIMTLVFVIVNFGWVWAIATVLQTKLSSAVKLKVGQFKILFLIPMVYILLLTVWIGNKIYSGPSGGN